MNARISRKWNCYDRRFNFVLVCSDRYLNNLYLGTDLAEAQTEAENVVSEVNHNRDQLGLSQINITR